MDLWLVLGIVALVLAAAATAFAIIRPDKRWKK